MRTRYLLSAFLMAAITHLKAQNSHKSSTADMALNQNGPLSTLTINKGATHITFTDAPKDNSDYLHIENAHGVFQFVAANIKIKDIAHIIKDVERDRASSAQYIKNATSTLPYYYPHYDYSSFESTQTINDATGKTEPNTLEITLDKTDGYHLYYQTTSGERTDSIDINDSQENRLTVVAAQIDTRDVTDIVKNALQTQTPINMTVNDPENEYMNAAQMPYMLSTQGDQYYAFSAQDGYSFTFKTLDSANDYAEITLQNADGSYSYYQSGTGPYVYAFKEVAAYGSLQENNLDSCACENDVTLNLPENLFQNTYKINAVRYNANDTSAAKIESFSLRKLDADAGYAIISSNGETTVKGKLSFKDAQDLLKAISYPNSENSHKTTQEYLELTGY